MFTVESLPKEITRARYQELIRELGFEDLRDIVSLEFHLKGIEVVVFARNENGRHVVDAESNELFRHTIFIPVVDR